MTALSLTGIRDMAVNILVLDANERSALAATRSLGRKGFAVFVADTLPETLAGASRFARGQAAYASPYEAPGAFFADVLRLIEEHGIQFLLPMTEATAYVILARRDELPATVTLPFPANADLDQLADKRRLVALAQELALPVPKTWGFPDAARARAVKTPFERFPLVVKPARSRILTAGGIIPTQVAIVHSTAELDSLLQRPDLQQHPFMIQEYIEGEGQGIFALYRQGEPVCFFAHRRLREKPPQGGVSVLSESRAIEPRMRDIADKLLSAAHWNGVAMVEFKVAADGTPYIMEVNPRFWGSLQLAIDAGVDFPYFLVQSYLEPGFQPPQSYRLGRRLRWLLGDLDRLYLVLKAPLARYSIPKKLLGLVTFCLPRLHTRHEVNRWSDLGPFWFELKRYLRDLRRG